MVKDTVTYDAWGNASHSNSAFAGRYLWTGREWDSEISLQYNRARFYDPASGRWVSQDPLGFDAGDSNLYRYVKNATSSITDPSGKIPPLLLGAGALAAFFFSGCQKAQPPAPRAKAMLKKVSVVISMDQKDGVLGYKNGRIANSNDATYGFTVTIKGNVAISQLTVNQSIFFLASMTHPDKNMGDFYAVADGNHSGTSGKKIATIKATEFQTLADAFTTSSYNSPKITFAPDGPSYINSPNPPLWYETKADDNNYVRYWDAPGLSKFGAPLEAKLYPGYTRRVLYWVRVTVSGPGVQELAEWAIDRTFQSNGKTWK